MWRSRFAYLLAFLILLAAAIFYDNTSVGFTAIYAVILLFLCALFSALFARRFIHISVSASHSTLFRNETLSFTVRVVNKSIFYFPRVRFHYLASDAASIVEEEAPFLPPRTQVKSKHTVIFPYRGIYKIGVTHLTATDFLGLFRIKVKIKEPVTVTVYPQVNARFSLPLLREAASQAFRLDAFDEDYSAVSDVRAYAPGDGARRIHWKLSARSQALMVKTYLPFAPNPMCLIIDTKEVPLAGVSRAVFEDKITSLAASFVFFALESRLSLDILYDAGGTLALTPNDAPEHALTVLAGLPFSAPVSPLSFRAREILRGSTVFNFAVLLWDIDLAVHDAVRDLVLAGHRAAVFCFFSDELTLTPEKQEFLASLRVLGASVEYIS